jgi:hypothetical protein
VPVRLCAGQALRRSFAPIQPHVRTYHPALGADRPPVQVRAEALSRKPGHFGAVAFSRTGDPTTGDFGDAKLIRKFGDVPDDSERAVMPYSFSGR